MTTPSSSNRLRPGVKHSLEQIIDDLVLVLLARLPDLGDLSVGLLVGFFLGGLVALGVLYFPLAPSPPLFSLQKTNLGLKLLVLLLLLGAVGFNLLFGFVAGFTDALGAVCFFVSGCSIGVVVWEGDGNVHSRARQDGQRGVSFVYGITVGRLVGGGGRIPFCTILLASLSAYQYVNYHVMEYILAKGRQTSRRVWIPAEFWADCRQSNLLATVMDATGGNGKADHL